eukprot:365198-Chlamydomonas_euryale.AAC.12
MTPPEGTPRSSASARCGPRPVGCGFGGRVLRNAGWARERMDTGGKGGLQVWIEVWMDAG